MRRTIAGRITVVCLLALAGVSLGLAQTTSATLEGVVRGKSGDPLDGAVVQARSETTGQVRSATTGADGRYRIDLLQPGRWTAVARGPVDGVSESRSVLLSLQNTVHLDFAIGSGFVEQVDVTARAPVFDPGRVGGELHILGEQTDALPIAGRNVTDLALIDSSVHVAPAGNFYGERGSVFVVNGQTGRSNSFLVDGLDNNDMTSGTSLGSFFSQQVISEFVVLTHQYSAEFGRASGGVLNIVTRRGSNRHSGDVFFQGSGERWNESGEFVDSLDVANETAQNTPSYLQGGFRFGGPIKRDKAFYFFAYEHQDRDEIVPWPGMNEEITPGEGHTFGGWVVANSRSDNAFFRADFNLSPSQTLMLRVSADDRETPDVNVGGRFGPEQGFDIEERDFQFGATLTSVISPSMYNEVRLLATDSEFNQFANSGAPGVSRPSGAWGGNELNLQTRAENRVQVVDNLTMVKNDHTVKVGVDVNVSSTDITADFNPAGNFLYTTDAAYDPNDVDTYALAYTYIFGEPSTTLDDTRYAVFAQDSWQATPKFLMDYGVRYDLSTYTLPKNARVDSTIPNGGAGKDTNNVAPRWGFTWTPQANGKTVLRGGAGLFYDKLALAFPAAAAVTSDTRIQVAPIQALEQQATPQDVEDLIELLGPDGYEDFIEGQTFFVPELTLRFSTAPELETPYTVQYTLGVERQLGARGSIGLDAIRSLGYHVPLMRDLNPVVRFDCQNEPDHVPEPGLEPCQGFAVHRDPSTGSIAAITTDGRSWYTGVDVAYRWRGQDAWGQAAYTWSKAEDIGPDPLKSGIYLPQNSDDPSTEKGPSDADRRHRLVLSGELGLPWAGLRLSGVLRMYSELPYNLTTGRDENGDGIVTDRPAETGRNSGPDAPLASVNQVRLEEGLSLLSSLPESSSYYQVDLRLTKPFAFNGGKVHGEFFVQAFNVTNRVNEGTLEGRVTSQNFGLPTRPAGPPRTIELGIKTGY